MHQTGAEKNNPIIETVCLTDIQYVHGQKGGLCVFVCVCAPLCIQTNKDCPREGVVFDEKRAANKGENRHECSMNRSKH